MVFSSTPSSSVDLTPNLSALLASTTLLSAQVSSTARSAHSSTDTLVVALKDAPVAEMAVLEQQDDLRTFLSSLDAVAVGVWLKTRLCHRCKLESTVYAW